MYIFRVGDKELSGFSGGGKSWILGIDDIDAGRTLLQEIARIYQLDASSAIDQTKGGTGAR